MYPVSKNITRNNQKDGAKKCENSLRSITVNSVLL